MDDEPRAEDSGIGPSDRPPSDADPSAYGWVWAWDGRTGAWERDDASQTARAVWDESTGEFKPIPSRSASGDIFHLVIEGPRSRRLRTVGVMHLVTAGLVGASPLVVALVVRGEAVLWLPVMIVFMGGWAAVHFVVGRDCVKGRGRGRTASIVVSGTALLLILSGWRDAPLYSLAAVAWFGAIAGLSLVAGRDPAHPEHSGTTEVDGRTPV